MNSPIPSLLLPLWQNEFLCETIGIKIKSPVCSFAWKSSYFHGKLFAQAIVLKKNLEVEVNKVSIMCMCQAAHRASACSSFCSMKRLEVFLLPRGWDAIPLQGYTCVKFASAYLYTWVDILRHCESKVYRPRTEYNVPSQGWNPDCSK